MPFIGNKPSAVPLTSADITDNIIVNADINTNAAITTEKLSLISTASVASVTAKGTPSVSDGYIQLNCEQNSHGIKIKSPPHSAGANYTLVMPSATGTSEQVLRMNSGATALEFASASSDFVLLSTTNQTSAIASISVDGYFSATYKNYMFVISNIVAASGSANFIIRFNQGGTVVSTGNYFWESAGNGAYTGASYAFVGDSNFSESYIRADKSGYAQSTTASQAGTLRFTLFDATSTTVSKNVSGEFSYWASNNPAHFGGTFSGGFIGNTTALTGVTFLMNTGNITSANIKLYGLK